jgi:antitoxin MazE
MGARSHIAKWGSSLAIRIPKPVAEQWGVREGSRIEMVPRGDQLVMSKRAYDLGEMLAQMSPETLHGEIDTGPAQGNEEW